MYPVLVEMWGLGATSSGVSEALAGAVAGALLLRVRSARSTADAREPVPARG